MNFLPSNDKPIKDRFVGGLSEPDLAQRPYLTSGSESPRAMVLAFLFLISLASPLGADTDLSQPEAAVEAGRDALKSQWDAPWYDKTADDLRAVNLPPPRKPSGFWKWLGDLFSSLSFDVSGLLTFLGWFLIAGIVGWIIYLLIKAFQNAELNKASQVTAAHDDTDYIERVEALPVTLDNAKLNLRDEAERLYRAGDLSAAMVYLFSHELVELDRHSLLRLVKGKTNRQYLRELRRSAANRPRLAAILSQTTDLFEAAFFGAHPPEREVFESCWRDVSEFETLLAQPAEEAA